MALDSTNDAVQNMDEDKTSIIPLNAQMEEHGDARSEEKDWPRNIRIAEDVSSTDRIQNTPAINDTAMIATVDAITKPAKDFQAPFEDVEQDLNLEVVQPQPETRSLEREAARQEWPQDKNAEAEGIIKGSTRVVSDGWNADGDPAFVHTSIRASDTNIKVEKQSGYTRQDGFHEPEIEEKMLEKEPVSRGEKLMQPTQEGEKIITPGWNRKGCKGMDNDTMQGIQGFDDASVIHKETTCSTGAAVIDKQKSRGRKNERQPRNGNGPRAPSGFNNEGAKQWQDDKCKHEHEKGFVTKKNQSLPPNGIFTRTDAKEQMNTERGYKKRGENENSGDLFPVHAQQNEVQKDPNGETGTGRGMEKMIPVGRKFITQQQLDDAIAAHVEGETITSIANRLGVIPRFLSARMGTRHEDKFSVQEFQSSVVSFLNEHGPTNETVLCNAMHAKNDLLAKHCPGNDMVKIEYEGGKKYYMLLGQSLQDKNANADLKTERSSRVEVTIGNEGQMHLPEGTYVFDVNLAGMQATVFDHRAFFSFTIDEQLFNKLPAFEEQKNKTSNRCYGKMRKANCRGEIKFRQENYLLGKEHAGHEVEIKPVVDGIAIKVVKPVENTGTRFFVVARKNENPTGLLKRLVDGHQNIWFSGTPYYVGHLKSPVFIEVLDEEQKILVYERNDRDACPLKTIDMMKKGRAWNERLVTSNGTFVLKNVAYFVGEEHAGTTVYIMHSDGGQTIAVYGDAACSRLIKKMPAREARSTDERDEFQVHLSSQGGFFWKGHQVYISTRFGNMGAFVEEVDGGQRLNIYSDKEMGNLLATATLPVSDLNPVLHVPPGNPDLLEKAMKMGRDGILLLRRLRLDGMPVTSIGSQLGLDYDATNALLEESNIHPSRFTIEDLQDYIDHAHPGAKITSGTCTSAVDRIQVTCENGHRFEIEARQIKVGHWCMACYEKNRLIAETHCRATVEGIFGVQFPKKRPPWLVNITGYRMELDMYNKDLGIAIEYNGIQHYEPCSYFHCTERDVQKNQEHDARKQILCKQHGVVLVTVPYWIKREDMKAFIIMSLHEAGVNVTRLRARMAGDARMKEIK